MIVHGDADEVVPFDYAKKAQELYQNAKIVPVHGADHCFNGHLEEMAEAIRLFFDATEDGKNDWFTKG